MLLAIPEASFESRGLAQTTSPEESKDEQGVRLMTKQRNQGFTLIEIMIVAAIIAIVAAIAIPSLLRARIQANEASAIESLRMIVTAEAAFHADRNQYATAFDPLITAEPPFMESADQPEKNGYTLEMGGTPDNFQATATPHEFGITGYRGFFVDASGIVRYEPGAVADETSTPIDS